MSKIIKYLTRLPSRVEHYGLKVTAIKVIIDTCQTVGVPLSPKVRWLAAHTFHVKWKRQQREYYGLKEYNRRIDEKSLEVLNDFYEVGTDFTGKTFIDVGCGTRGVLPIIKAKHRIGVDPALKQLKDFPLPLGIEYYPDKAEELRFSDGFADIVSCNNTLNHVENPKQAIREIYRVLKKGGLFLLEVFIEPRNISHTEEFTPHNLEKMIHAYFTPIREKYEQLKVRVEIDENLDGPLPMRWGGVYKK